MLTSNKVVGARQELRQAQRVLRHLRARLASTSVRAIDFDLLDDIRDFHSRVAAARETLRELDPTFTK